MTQRSKSTKTISVEIHPDMEADFYFWLYTYKTTKRIDTLSRMADCIAMDPNEVKELCELVAKQSDAIDKKTQTIYEFLITSKNYKVVAGTDFTIFKNSKFVAEILPFFYIIELKRKLDWNHSETIAKVAISILSGGFHLLFSAIGEAIANVMNQQVNKSFGNSKDETQGDKISAEIIYDKEKLNEINLSEIRPTYELFANAASILLKNLTNSELNEWRNSIVFNLCDIVDKHYPNLLETNKNVVVGIICSQLNFVITEKKHKDSNSPDSYKSILNTFVRNIKKAR